jgi:hypothetical protein
MPVTMQKSTPLVSTRLLIVECADATQEQGYISSTHDFEKALRMARTWALFTASTFNVLAVQDYHHDLLVAAVDKHGNLTYTEDAPEPRPFR